MRSMPIYWIGWASAARGFVGIGILGAVSGFYVENFGCRAARADGEAVSARLLAGGLAERGLADADVVVVNTCSVTAEADRDARAFVRKARRVNPAARVVVTGCYAQRAPKEIAALPGVTAVVGNSHKALVPGIVLGLAGVGAQEEQLVPVVDLVGAARVWADDGFAHSSIEVAQVMPGAQTRPNLKIQEGCGNRCTFCVIPATRGASRSLAAEKVLGQVRGFVEAGGKELVISGINLGQWGRDLAEKRTLAGLVREILTETGLARLRLSSIEPMDWTAELIGLMGEFGGRSLARHAHLPLQSGSDAVLRRMHRRYRPWHYAKKVTELVKAAGPELAVGADVMVGFPGETEGEFRETYELVRELPFTYLHLFPFSARPGTRGWELHRVNPVAAGVMRERMRELTELAAEKMRRFREGFVGRELPAITLHASGLGAALTDNYLPVELMHTAVANELGVVRVAGVSATGALQGVLV